MGKARLCLVLRGADASGVDSFGLVCALVLGDGAGDSDANGPGGLWVNWRYGTQPLQANINGTGEPDGTSINPPSHDELTDLRYIHNLWSYKRQNLADTSFDGEITRYTAIIKHEFAHSHNERGWLYDEASALLATWSIRSQN